MLPFYAAQQHGKVARPTHTHACTETSITHTFYSYEVSVWHVIRLTHSLNCTLSMTTFHFIFEFFYFILFAIFLLNTLRRYCIYVFILFMQFHCCISDAASECSKTYVCMHNMPKAGTLKNATLSGNYA